MAPVMPTPGTGHGVTYQGQQVTPDRGGHDYTGDAGLTGAELINCCA
jgi:hypothetical protein